MSNRPHPPAPSGELAALRLRLAEVEETLRAIRQGEVDAVVVAGRQGPQVFTLEGADHAYRVLIESMNEGALTLTAGKTILYANHCFADMVKCPLEQVIGGSLHRFLPVEARASLRSLLRQLGGTNSKIQVLLTADDGSQIPAQLSLRTLAQNGSKRAPIGLVVTNLTEARRTEAMLRALTKRVVQVQEAERAHLAVELHDNITQLLCAVLFGSKALAGSLPARSEPAKAAGKLCRMVGEAAGAVERISHNLRPSVLEQLGLVAVLRETSRQFGERTGVPVKLTCRPPTARLSADTELTLYRILQEALRNVEQHARARHVTVDLWHQGANVWLTVKDDGVGFNPDRLPAGRKDSDRLGLLGLRERATYVGGTLRIKSGRATGTELEVQIPLPPLRSAARRHPRARQRK